jgi:hypothetical protein
MSTRWRNRRKERKGSKKKKIANEYLIFFGFQNGLFIVEISGGKEEHAALPVAKLVHLVEAVIAFGDAPLIALIKSWI